MVGYSKRPLVDKLGIKPGYRCLLIKPPKDFPRTLGKLPAGATLQNKSSGEFDFIQAFFEDSSELSTQLPRLKEALKKSGMIWASWKKEKVSDLTEDVVRDQALDVGLVDVKVCAVDDVWSGLKLVYRLKDR